MKITIDPEFRDLLGSLEPDEYQLLKTQLLRDGQEHLIVLWGDIIVDGHNRYAILTENGVEPKYTQKEFESREAAMFWIYETQKGRRNLNAFRCVELAKRFEPQIAARNKVKRLATLKQNAATVPQNSAERKTETRNEIAKLAGTSHDTVDRVNYIKKHGTEEQINRARQGGKGNSVNSVYTEVKKEKMIADGITAYVCKTCGTEKTLDEYEPGRTSCKVCRNRAKPPAPTIVPEEIKPYVFAEPEPPTIVPRRDKATEAKAIKRIVADLKNPKIDRSNYAVETFMITYEAFAQSTIRSLDSYDKEPYGPLYAQLTEGARIKMTAFNTAMLKAVERRNIKLKG